MMLMREELLKMDGKPVYLQLGSGDFDEGWAICEVICNSPAFYVACGSLEPDYDFYNLMWNDPDGRFGLHVLGWRAFDKEPCEYPTVEKDSDITKAVQYLRKLESEITDKKTLKALRVIAHAALWSELGPGPCEACFDGVYITDSSPTYAGVEHPYCAECGRKLKEVTNG